MRRLLGFASLAGVALLLLPTCRTTRHTVARIVTPAPVPTEVFVPAEPAPTASPPPPPTVIPPTAPPSQVTPRTPVPRPAATPVPRPSATRIPATSRPVPSATATVAVPAAVTPVVTPAGTVLEQYVPTVVAETPTATSIATRAVSPSPRSTRVPRTPTPGVTQKPGVYYEDEEGRPLTPTPRD